VATWLEAPTTVNTSPPGFQYHGSSGGGGSGGLTDAELRASAVKVEPLGQPNVTRKITVTAASDSVTLTTTCRRVSLEAVGCNQRYVVGTGPQTANASTSHWLAVGTRLDIAVPANAILAAIRDNDATTDGVLEASELI